MATAYQYGYSIPVWLQHTGTFTRLCPLAVFCSTYITKIFQPEQYKHCIPADFYALSTGCTPGHYGDTCQLECSSLGPGCAQCSQDGQCTACRDEFAAPSCTGNWQ